MGLTDLLKDVGRALTLTAALYNCGGEEKQGCQTDYDCREPRVCVRGYCEGPDGSEGEGEVNVHNGDGRCGDSPFNDRYLTMIAGCGEFTGSTFFNSETCTLENKKHTYEYSGTRIGSCNLIRNFSCSEVDEGKERCSNYQCAISENNDVFVRECGKLDLFDNLYLVSNSPLTQASCESIIRESWYADCFRGTEP